MPLIADERGAGSLKLFGFLLVAFLIIHAGLKVVPMYMDYSRMEDEMRMKAGVAQVLKDEEILADLVKKAKELDLPLTENSFILARDAERRRMMIKTKTGWDIELRFLWGLYVRTFHFDIQIEEGFMSITR